MNKTAGLLVEVPLTTVGIGGRLQVSGPVHSQSCSACVRQRADYPGNTRSVAVTPFPLVRDDFELSTQVTEISAGRTTTSRSLRSGGWRDGAGHRLHADDPVVETESVGGLARVW